SAAFEVGKPATLTPSDPNNLYKTVMSIWKANRLDSIIQKLVKLKKSQTQGAVQFYIKDVKENSSLLNKALVKLGLKKLAKEIKVKLLDNESGKMTPYFDGQGDLILFMWEYASKVGGKDINYIEIWDTTTC